MHVNNTDKQASQALIEYANDDDDVDERQGTHAHAHTTYAYLRTEPLFDGIRGCVCVCRATEAEAAAEKSFSRKIVYKPIQIINDECEDEASVWNFISNYQNSHK